VPAGCGGIKLFHQEYGKIKRMYVRPAFRGRGPGKAMLAHLAQFTSWHGIALLRRETGIYETEAIGLYESFGFRRCPPFGDYREDPNSVYFETAIA
jgi:ribosomal protein S18 acetylase RimI-like enzyme